MAGLSRAQRRILWDMCDGFEIWDTTEGTYLMNADGKWVQKIYPKTLFHLKCEQVIELAESTPLISKYRINDDGRHCARP